MEEILNIQTPVAFDESVAHYEIHAHQPYTASTYNNSDEIRISIQHQDLCLLPARSSLHVCGRIVKADNSAVENTSLVNNAICHLFEEVRYEINAIEIDRCKNVGLTTLMKGWISINPNQSLENAGWLDVEERALRLNNNEGYFDVCIPLSMILGFAEDYRKIVVNVKHELIITRSRNDLNAVVQTAAGNPAAFEDFKINLTRIEWLMPYVLASNAHKIRLLNYIEKDRPIAMSFRSWELFEYPLLPATPKHVWTVKTSNQMEKPRFVVVGFQTNRKGQKAANASRFDHCNISNVKLFLNSQCYPYGNLNLDISHNQYAVLYEMYTNFQSAYYEKQAEPVLNKNDYITHLPLIVIDCSKQNESLKSAPVDVRLEFEARNNFPAGTSAYCLILHDRIVQYNPVSGDVKKLV